MIINKRCLLLVLVLLLHIVSMMGYNGYYLVAAVSILYVFLHIYNLKKKKYISRGIIFALIFIAMINEAYCLYKYNQGFFEGIFAIYFIFSAFIYFAFYDYFEIDINRIWKIITIIENIAVTVALLAIIQAFILPTMNLFDYSYRNGNIRIYGTALGYFAMLFILGKILNKQASLVEKIKLGILIVMLLFVSQSRGGIITLAVSLLWVILSKIWNSGIKKALIGTAIFMILISIVFYVIYKLGYFNFIFTVFEEISDGSGSGATRTMEIDYYQKLMSRSPLMGIGILRGGSSLANEIYRQDLSFYIEDTGLFGFICQTGFWGIAWIIYLLVNCIKKIYNLKLSKNNNAKAIMYTFIMILITSVIGFTFTNYLVARSSIALFFMLLAMADILIGQENKICKGCDM